MLKFISEKLRSDATEFALVKTDSELRNLRSVRGLNIPEKKRVIRIHPAQGVEKVFIVAPEIVKLLQPSFPNILNDRRVNVTRMLLKSRRAFFFFFLAANSTPECGGCSIGVLAGNAMKVL